MAPETFAFSFSGDDIDDEFDSNAKFNNGSLPKNKPESSQTANLASTLDSVHLEHATADGEEGDSKEQALIRARKWTIDELFESLPSSMSYYTTIIRASHKEYTVPIPRRALFDVRMQLMAENETVDAPNQTPNSTSETETGGLSNPRDDRTDNALLGDSDIEKSVYEGGFKSWEGAADLARAMLDRKSTNEDEDSTAFENIVELGCGTALPALVLFHQQLQSRHSSASHPIKFTLADYNDSVLRLVTVPNLLLVWASQHHPSAFSPAPPIIDRSTGVLHHADGDLEVTLELLSSFRSHLSRERIQLSFISGHWSPAGFLPLVFADSVATEETRDAKALILAAETVYSPDSLPAFTDTLLALLRHRGGGTSRALVAAKRLYFGVGGGVDAFVEAVRQRGGSVEDVTEELVPGIADRGVGRCILKVTTK